MSSTPTTPDQATPTTPPATPNQATPTTTTSAPTVVQPVRSGGLKGIIEEFRDAVAGGNSGPGSIYTDGEGNQYVQHPNLSGPQKWLKIAGTAIRGAAAGAASKGPWKAAEAGLEAGDKVAEQQKADDKDLSDQARQHNIDKANAIKLKMDTAAREFELKRLQVKGTQEDITFSQQQQDREKQLGSADLGIATDEAHLADKFSKEQPDFWKLAHDGSHGRIIAHPEFDPETGERVGLHFFLRKPLVGNMPADLPTFNVFNPETKKIETHTATVPLTHNEQDTYNNVAQKAKQDADLADARLAAEQAEGPLKEAQTDEANAGVPLKKAQTKEAKAGAEEKTAEAGKAGAEQKKIEQETQQAAQTAAHTDDLVKSVVAGRVVPERLGYMLGKKEGQEFLSKVVAADPNIDVAKLQAYPALYKDFTGGKRAQSMGNLNTSFQHIYDLRKLNTDASRIPGTPAAHAYESKLVNTSAEVANSLSKPGATASNKEIDDVKKSLNTTLNRGAAIDTQIHSLVQQYKTFRNQWIEGAPSSVYEGKMPDLSPEAKNVLRKFASETQDRELANDVQSWWGRPYYVNGQLIGYSKDGKTLE